MLVRAITHVSHCSRCVTQAGIVASDYLITAGYGLCEQNFVMPGINLPQIQDNIDYDVSLCFTCNLDEFTLQAMGNTNQVPVTGNSTVTGVMISTTLVMNKYVLVIPVPRTPFGSVQAIIACNGESYLVRELGMCSVCVSLFVSLSTYVYVYMCSTYGLC